MKKYKVTLSRTYFVSVEAEDQESALRLAEFYVGDCRDASSKAERLKYNFAIRDIELVNNDAMEVVKETS